MKSSSLKALIIFAILSNTSCIDLGRLFGLGRDSDDFLSQTEEPQIIEVVRWRQPVCVIPGPEVPPCIENLRKYQNEYESNSSTRIEINQPEKPKVIRNDEKQIEIGMKNPVQHLKRGINEDIELGSSRDEIIEEYCNEKAVNVNSGVSDLEIGKKSMKIIEAMKKIGIFKEDDHDSLKDICDDFVLSPKLVSFRVVNSIQVENIDRVNLDGSEMTSTRFNSDESVTLNLSSRTPEMGAARIYRQGRDLLVVGIDESHRTSRWIPGIYVTKVLNSPVTATLVANNCYPDIGVPLCNEYEETLKIYKEPEELASGNKENRTLTLLNGSSMEQENFTGNVQENTESPDILKNLENSSTEISPEITEQTTDQSVEDNFEENVQENNESLDFSSHSVDQNLEEASTTENLEYETKSQIVTNSESESIDRITTSKPGIINNLLNIHEPVIVEEFLKTGFNIFNRNTTVKPESTVMEDRTENSEATGSTDGGLEGQGSLVEGIEDRIHENQSIGQVTTPKSGLIESLENFWKSGFNIFNKNTTVKPESTGMDDGTENSEATGFSDGGEDIQNRIHEPNVISSTEEPEIQTVPGIQRTKRPGFFENLWKPLSGFRPFDNIPNDEEAQTKSTQATGFFEEHFKNILGRISVNETDDNTNNFLGNGSRILVNEENKPIVIERPGALPLLLEKPIYIDEKPNGAGRLLTFLIPDSNNSIFNMDHEVIKEPVYVHLKPKNASRIRNKLLSNVAVPSKPGFVQGWAVFVKRSDKFTKSNETNTTNDEILEEDHDAKAIDETDDSETEETPKFNIDEISEAIAANETEQFMSKIFTKKTATIDSENPSSSSTSFEEKKTKNEIGIKEILEDIEKYLEPIFETDEKEETEASRIKNEA